MFQETGGSWPDFRTPSLRYVGAARRKVYTILMFGFNLGQLLAGRLHSFQGQAPLLFGKISQEHFDNKDGPFDSSEWEGRDKRVKLLCASRGMLQGFQVRDRERGPVALQ